MFPLLSLPNELVLRIIDQLHPATIEPFAACGNKKINSLIEERLARHRYQKANYSTLVFGKDALRERLQERHGWQISSPYSIEDCACQFIGQCVQDNYLAYYPEMLCLESSDFEGEWYEPGLEFTLGQAVGPKLPSELVSSMPPCSLSEKEEENLDHTENPSCCNWDLNTAILFAMLPTLRSVFILEYHDGDLRERCVSRFVRHVADASRRTGATPYMIERALPLLKELTIEFDLNSEDDAGSEDDIATYAPFAMLPSMRTLQGKNVTGRSPSEPCSSVFLWPFGMPERSLSITAISFIKSAVNARTFKSFIMGFTALREFTYHHEDALGGYVVYQPQEIVEALKAYAADTLVKLDLSARQSELNFREIASQHVVSLDAFTALKSVRADDALFVAPDWENTDEEAVGTQDMDETEENDGDRCSTVPLWTLLPATCETLNLIHYRRKTAKLFRNFLAHKDSHLSKLKKITIEDTNWMGVRFVEWPDPLSPPLDDAIKESFENAGIECCTVQSEVSYSYRERS